MMPAKINTTGNDTIDTETAQLAVHLRDAGMPERVAINEAQRIRDALLAAAIDTIAADRHAVPSVHTTWYDGNQRAETVVRRLTGNFGCRCTGFDGCPNPSGCGTPQGCLCGA